MVDFFLRFSWAVAVIVFLVDSLYLIVQYRSKKLILNNPIALMVLVFLILYILFGLMVFLRARS